MRMFKMMISGLYLFATFQTKAQICYSTRSDYPGSADPRNIVSADFDGNGKPDLAVANYNTLSSLQTMTVYLNIGNGVFGAGTTYTMATGAHGIVAADLNADGRIDLVTANKSSNNVSVRLGNGNGTFAAVANYAVGVGPQALTAVDVNNDGRSDLVIANSTAGTVSVLLGSGTGTFGAATNYVVGTGPNRVVSRDFNGDGASDLAITCGGNNAVRILLNTGTGLFSPAVSYAVSTGASSLVAEDFNGDGKWDIAAGCMPAGGGMVSVLLGNGNGTFATSVNYPVNGFQVWDIYASDINSDGRNDLITANNESPNGVSLLYGNANGTFAPPLTIRNVTGTPLGITSADYNADGRMDIATANFITTNSTVYLSAFNLYNALSDTTRVCGSTAVLDAGSGYATYTWNIGATTQTITPATGGFYKVTVVNAAGCSSSDSTILSLANARINNNDTTICKGSSITLSIDSLYTGLTSCSSSGLPANLRTGLVGYWPFCGNANDVSGNSNNGSVNGPVLVADRFGLPNRAYYFDGINDYISVPDNPTMNFSVTKAMTLSFWVKLASVGQYEGLITKWGELGDVDDDFTVAFNNLGNALLFDVNSSAVIPSPNSTLSTTNYANAQWAHFVMQWDGVAQVMRMYKDNVLITSASGVVSAMAHTAYALIFGRGNSLPSPFYANMTLDDVFLYNRILSPAEINSLFVITPSVLWSTGATTNTITVSPTQTTTYYVTVSDGITTCTDSVKVTVSDIGPFNPLQDTTRVCGTSTVLDAGSGYATYSWNTGATTQTINATTGGFYKVTLTNATGCSASDSTFLSLVKANIIQNDTLICKGSSITLNIDSLFPGYLACNVNQLPTNLGSGLVGFWPFCGNANDVSGGGNNGTITGANFTTNRYNSANAAILTSAGVQYVKTQSVLNVTNTFTVSLWVNPQAPDILIPEGITGLESYGTQPVIHPPHGSNWGSAATNAGVGISVGTNQIDIIEHTHLFIASPLVYRPAVPLIGWHHIVLVYNSHLPQLYVDGVMVRTGLISSIANVHPGSGFDPVYSASGFGRSFTPGGSPLGQFTGKFDDIKIFDRALSNSEIVQLNTIPPVITWSTGATTNGITVSPTQATTYYVTVSDGITTCTDSVKVTVSDLSSFNPLQDTTRICGTSTVLDAGSGYATYSWNTGANTQTINATAGGFYKVTVTNATGCSASDSTFLSLVNARIINNDTTICKGSSITLSIDSLFPGRTVCTASLLSSNLQNGLVAYYPFCSNANDASGNGYNGVVTGAIPEYDRFGIPVSAYRFNGSSSVINATVNTIPQGDAPRTISLWLKTNGPFPSNGNGYGSAIEYGTFLLSRRFGILVSDFLNAYFVAEGNDANTAIYLGGNTWKLLTMTYSAGQVRFYLNGVFAGSGNVAALNTTGNNLRMGNTINNGSNQNERYNGVLDDVLIWNRVLSDQDIRLLYSAPITVNWSTGATANTITVNPIQTTTYYVTVSDGITTCTDSVKVTVSDIGPFNPLQDTTRICGTSTVLDAGSGYATYSWNMGATTQTITATTGGFYKVTVTNAVSCSASDSTFLSLVNARILNNDTTICKGSTIPLSIDSLFPGRTVCNANQLPSNLRNGLVGYWPFCGNANDMSGNGNNGIVNGPILSSDRFNNPLSSYYFDGTGFITIPDNNVLRQNNLSVHAWIQMEPISPQGSFVISKVNTTNVSAGLFNVQVWDQSRIVSAFHNKGNCSAGDANWQFLDAITSAITNKWVNIVSTFGQDSIKTYINGVLVNKTAASNTTLDLCSGSTINIGKWWNTDPRYIIGKIDDVGVWNRALSQFEVAQLFSTTPHVIWSTGATTNTITVNPTQTTTYYVTVSDGITTCTDSVKVTISTVDTSLTVLDPLQVCAAGGQVRLRAGVAATYQWQSSPNGITFSNISGAVSQDYTALTTGYYRAIVTNALDCVDSTRIVQVVLNPQPVPSFTVDSNPQCLSTNNFTFTNTSTIGGGTMTYVWTFGDGGTATTTNASHVYAAAGTYTVKLVATSNNGCKDSTAQTVLVNASPVAEFTINNNAQCVNGNSFVFTNTSTISAGTLLYDWSFGDGGTATTVNSTHTYGAAGTYTVKLVVRSTAGCADSITHQVTVYPMPTGSVSTPSAMNLCEGSSVILTASGGDTYQWLLGGQPIPGATGSSYTAIQPGVYSVMLVSVNGCHAMAAGSTTLTLIRKPVADFSYTKYCAGFPTQFSNTAVTTGSGVVVFQWDFGDGSTSTLENPSHVFATPGTYTVSLSVTPLACPALAAVVTKTVNITAPPANQRYPSLNAVSARNLQLTARTFTGAQYFWIPSAGLSNNFIQNPVFNYNRQQQYLIQINTTEGCVVTDTVLIRIFKEREIYVPDVFSPNGDGKNDKLTPLLVGIASLKYFKVFDRWGQLMFSTNVAGAGWDGYYKGVKQPFETYAWIAEGVDIDGNTIKRSGSSILIR